jgi:hypothetical protein
MYKLLAAMPKNQHQMFCRISNITYKNMHTVEVNSTILKKSIAIIFVAQIKLNLQERSVARL